MIRLLIFFQSVVFANSYALGLNLDFEGSIKQLLEKAERHEEKKEYRETIDVYKSILKVAKEEQLNDKKGYIFNKIGINCYRLNDMEQAKSYYKKSILVKPFSNIAAKSYFNLSLVYRIEHSSDSLSWALNNALKIYDSLEDTEDKFSVYSKAGIIFKQKGQYEHSIKYLLKAYHGFLQSKDTVNLATVSGNIANVQSKLGNLSLAKEYYRNQLNLRRKLNDSLKISFSYNNLGNLYYREEQLDSSLFFYEKAVSIQTKLKNEKNLAKTYGNIGLVFFEKNEFNKAEIYYKKALALKNVAHDSLAIAHTLNELVITSIKRNDIRAAKVYLNETEDYLQFSPIKSVLIRNYFVKSEYFKAIGNFSKAYHYQSLQFELYKEVFSEEQAKTIQTLQEQFESELKQQQISNLTLEVDEKASIIDTQTRSIKKREWLLILFGLAIIFLTAAYVYIRQRQKIKSQEVEYIKLKAVFEGQELIKGYVSRDLHDIISTNLDAIRLKALALKKAKNKDEIHNQIIQDIKSTNHEIRMISHRLSPLSSRLKGVDLTEVMVSFFSEFQHHRQIFVDVQLPLPEALNSFSLESQTNFYGIILEIFNNIEKHSQANSVRVRHKTEKSRWLCFEISDNGIGLQDQSSGGIGITNIKQRVFLLNGDFNIESKGEGTIIKIKLPIPTNAA